MSEEVFTPEQEVYTLSGRKVEYVEKVAEGHLVRSKAVDGARQPRFVAEVCLEPPTDHLHADVVRLQEQAATLRAELQELRTARGELSRAQGETLKQLQKLQPRAEELHRLEAFLDGEITHFVRYSERGPGVAWVEDADTLLTETAARLSTRVRLLSLYGDTSQRLSWRVNTYSDGSGREMSVIPCTSLEEAQSICRERTQAYVDTVHAAGLPLNLHELKTAEASGAAIPPELAQRTKAAKAAEAYAKGAKHEAEAQRALLEGKGFGPIDVGATLHRAAEFGLEDPLGPDAKRIKIQGMSRQVSVRTSVGKFEWEDFNGLFARAQMLLKLGFETPTEESS